MPLSVNSNQNSPHERREWSSGALTAVERVGGILPADIHGELIDRLSNIITVNVGHHVGFGRLDWWMEPAPSGVRTA